MGLAGHPPTATYYDYITRLYFDPNSGKVIYYGCYFAGGYGGYEEDLRNELHVGTVSGTSISFGATTTFEPFVYFEDLAFADDPVSGKPVIAYRWVDSIYDSGGKASSLTVSGTSVTVDTPDVLSASVSGGIGLATDTADNAVVATFGGSGTELDFAAGTVDGAFAFTEVDVDQTLTIDYGSPRLLAYDPDTDYALTAYRVYFRWQPALHRDGRLQRAGRSGLLPQTDRADRPIGRESGRPGASRTTLRPGLLHPGAVHRGNLEQPAGRCWRRLLAAMHDLQRAQ